MTDALKSDERPAIHHDQRDGPPVGEIGHPDTGAERERAMGGHEPVAAGDAIKGSQADRLCARRHNSRKKQQRRNQNALHPTAPR